MTAKSVRHGLVSRRRILERLLIEQVAMMRELEQEGGCGRSHGKPSFECGWVPGPFGVWRQIQVFRNLGIMDLVAALQWSRQILPILAAILPM